MRRLITILLLNLAYGILIVHAVIPHHHHEQAACFVTPAQHEHDHGHKSGHCQDHHHDDQEDHHHMPDDNGDCLLYDLLAIVPVTYKLEDPGFDFNAKYIGDSHYSYTIPGQGVELHINVRRIEIDRLPYVLSAYETTHTHSHSLRGPPYC